MFINKIINILTAQHNIQAYPLAVGPESRQPLRFYGMYIVHLMQLQNHYWNKTDKRKEGRNVCVYVRKYTA